MTKDQSIIAALVAIVLASLIAVSIRPEIAGGLPACGILVVVAGLLGALNSHVTPPAPARAPDADPNAPGAGPST